MAEPCFVCKCMACLGHVLVLSHFIPRPLVILILSLLPSLSPVPLISFSLYNPLVFAVLCWFIVSLWEYLPMNTLSLKNVLILYLLLVYSLVKCSSLVISHLFCPLVGFVFLFVTNKPCVHRTLPAFGFITCIHITEIFTTVGRSTFLIIMCLNMNPCVVCLNLLMLLDTSSVIFLESLWSFNTIHPTQGDPARTN